MDLIIDIEDLKINKFYLKSIPTFITLFFWLIAWSKAETPSKTPKVWDKIFEKSILFFLNFCDSILSKALL